MEERDVRDYRYRGSIRNRKSTTFIPVRAVFLTNTIIEIENRRIIASIPKKGPRKEIKITIDFSKALKIKKVCEILALNLNEAKNLIKKGCFLGTTNDDRQIILMSYADYGCLVNNRAISPFCENDSSIILVYKENPLLDMKKNIGVSGIGPYSITYRKLLLKRLLRLCKITGQNLISEEEISIIKKMHIKISKAIKEEGW